MARGEMQGEMAMPEFILDHGDAETAKVFRGLDSFTQGYIEAMFFTDCEHGTVRPDPDEATTHRTWNPEENSSLPGDVSFADLAPATLARIVDDCLAFQERYSSAIDDARELVPGGDGFKYGHEALTEQRLGNLFWYARQGHGVAFTDDGDAPCLKVLQGASKLWRQTDSDLGDDGLIYLS